MPPNKHSYDNIEMSYVVEHGDGPRILEPEAALLLPVLRNGPPVQHRVGRLDDQKLPLDPGSSARQSHATQRGDHGGRSMQQQAVRNDATFERLGKHGAQVAAT